MAPKSFFKNLTIPSPCAADWNSMKGNDQVRFCEHCCLEVHNVSLMTRTQAERLIARSKGQLCVRYHHNEAGQPLTLPVGQKLHRMGRRVSRFAAGAFTATLSVTSTIAQPSGNSQLGNLNRPAAEEINVQSGTGSISGTIKDQNGALITAATVSILNQQGTLALYASTDFNGTFKIESLAAGIYNLRIEAPGFAADEVGNIYLRAGDEMRLERTLDVAHLEEKVDIESEGDIVSSTGGVVSIIAPADPFIRAAQEDNLEELTTLISGKDVNLRDKSSGTTALEHAVRNANREMVQLLISAGANVNTKNESGETVLMMLDDDATSDLVWDLINAGAKVNVQDDAGNTALMQAATANNLEMLKALIDAGAEINTRNKAGRTALIFAASEGSINIVRTLVVGGADITVTDRDNMNALAHAVGNDHLPVVRFLKSKGAIETVAKNEKEE